MKKLSTLLLFSTFLVNSILASSEFFMKINTNGNYTVSLGNQTISTSANVFRFFDLANGNYQLRVIENSYNGRVVYDKPIFINDGFRFIAELDAFNGLNVSQPAKQSANLRHTCTKLSKTKMSETTKKYLQQRQWKWLEFVSK